jgi:hypothetical protein
MMTPPNGRSRVLDQLKDGLDLVVLFAAALAAVIYAIVWLSDRIRAFTAARKAKADRLPGYDPDPNAKRRGTFE